MVGAGFHHPKQVTKPVGRILLLALCIMAAPFPSVAQTSRPPSGVSPTCPAPEAYTLGAGDRVQLDVFNVPEYSREYQVLADGTVNLPIVGSVPVRGQTLAQAANTIQARYSPFLRRPIITLNLTAPRPLNVAISGEVQRPGSYSLPVTGAGGGVQLPTVTQALTQAGGITQSANLRQVRLLRPQRPPIVLNLFDLVQNSNLCQNIALRDGDSIIVPTGAALSATEAQLLATTSFSPAQNQPINILVVGEVTRPGSYVVQPDQTGAQPTVMRAIQVAGGIRQTADISQVEIRRTTRRGETQTFSANLSQLLQTGDRSQDLILQQGDTIVVPAETEVSAAQSLPLASTSISPTGAQPLNIAVIGEVQRPGTYVLQPAQPPTVVVGALPTVAGLPTVTQAIQIAGGITQTADIRRIEVRRATQAGVQRSIPVDFWQLLVSGDRTQDVVLQQGDTIFIPTAADVSPAEAALLASASFSPATIPVNVVGEVARPGIVQIPPNTPLNQALLAAGGFNSRARRGKVELLRLNPNGTVSRRTLEVDFEKGANDQNNPTLRPNDVVVVARSGVAQVSDFFGTVLNPVTSGASLLNFFLRIFGAQF